MGNGYKILWTSHALSELNETIDYLLKNWSEKELKNFAKALDNTLELISKNPKIFQKSSSSKSIRRAVVSKYNNLYYRCNEDTVEVISLFSNRKNPKSKKIN